MSINNMEYILSISILSTVDLSHLKSLNFDFMDYSMILFSTTISTVFFQQSVMFLISTEHLFKLTRLSLGLIS